MNGLATRLAGAFATTPVQVILNLFGVSAVIWLALYVMLRVGIGEAAPEPLHPLDGPVAAGLLAALLVPFLIVAGLAVFIASLYLVSSTRGGEPLRRVALIALAATGPILWGPMLQAVMGPEITRLEAMIIGLTGLRVTGNVFWSLDGHATFVVAGGCSALANISLTLLLLAVLTQAFETPLTWRLIPVALAAVSVTVMVNSFRLVLLAVYPQHFDYLHHGTGSQIFGWAGLVLVGVVEGVGVFLVARPSH